MSENKRIQLPEMGATLEGAYKVAVVDAQTNEIVWEQPDWQKNLIVNDGMDNMATQYFCRSMYWADAGSGTRQNSISSGTSTATADGAGNVNMSTIGSLTDFTQSVSGYTTASVTGDMIKFSGGAEARILSVTGLALTVTPSITVAPDETFTIWKTSQTSLQNHLKYAGSGVAGSSIFAGWPYCGNYYSDNVIYTRKTFDFPAQTIGEGLVNYTEVGTRVFIGTGVGNSKLFSRVLLPSPVAVDVGQKLRLSYELRVAYYPTASTNRPNVPVSGWPVAGIGSTNTNASESIQCFIGLGAYVNGTYLAGSSLTTDGVNETGLGALEPTPRSMPYCWVSTSTSSLVDYYGTIERGSGSGFPYAAQSVLANASYTPLSFYIDRTCTFSEAQANYNGGTSPGIGSIGVGHEATYYRSYNQGYHVFDMVLEQTQSKTNTQTLTLGWRVSWSRILA